MQFTDRVNVSENVAATRRRLQTQAPLERNDKSAAEADTIVMIRALIHAPPGTNT